MGNSLTSNRIEVHLQRILLVARAESAKASQNHENITEQLNRNREHLQFLLSNGNGTILPDEARLDQLSEEGDGASSDAAQESTFDTEGVKAFHHNGKVLFESSQLTAVSAIGIRTAQFPRTACNRWCSCVCHHKRHIQTPQLLQNLIGSLFIGYSGLPMLTKPCDQYACHQRAQPTSSVTYYFPSWFLARTLSILFSSTPLAGPVVSLKCQRTVPRDADIFKIARAGNVDKMRDLFEKGLASPHDVNFESGGTALRV